MYHRQPSRLLNLKQRLRADGVFDPEYIAWSFDSAVEWVGGYIESKLYKAEDAQAELDALLKADAPDEIDGTDAALLVRMKLNMALGNTPFEGMKGARS